MPKKKVSRKKTSRKKTKAKSKAKSKASTRAKKTTSKKKISKKVRSRKSQAKKTKAAVKRKTGSRKRSKASSVLPGALTPGRFIVCLGDASKSAVNKAQKALNVQLTSSVELCSTVRAHDIMQSGNGIHFKNLGIAVVDDIEAAKIQAASIATSNPIVYWEAEREYFPANEQDAMSKLHDIKVILGYLTEQVDELEKLMLDQEQPPVDTGDFTWGLREIGMPHSQYTGRGINLCVLDTGFYLAHPDFAGRNIIGKSFIDGQVWDKDKFGHGTHCAGTAAGGVSLEDGMHYGVASEANLYIGKVLADSGRGNTSGIVDAIDWAIEKQCQVVSMSLGSKVRVGERPSFVYEQVGRKALEQGTLLIAAAGNDSRRSRFTPKPVSSPANAESIMAVAALNEDLTVANFSNGGINTDNGGRIDIAAPGVDVYSAYSKNARNGSLYTSMSGTSMATPHVAGIAALIAEAFPGISAAELWLKLERRAKILEDQLMRDVGKGLARSI